MYKSPLGVPMARMPEGADPYNEIEQLSSKLLLTVNICKKIAIGTKRKHCVGFEKREWISIANTRVVAENISNSTTK